MRKITGILGVITIVALLLGSTSMVPALAQTQVPVSINAPDQVAEDSDFTATVDIGDVVDLNAAQYEISSDNTVLRLDDITSGQIDGTEIPVMFNEISPGTYRVVHSLGLNTVTGLGNLSVLHFHVVGSQGDSSNISLSNGMLSGLEGEIEASWTGDSVDIGIDTDPPTVDSVSPGANAPNVAIDAVVSATFDEAIQEGDNFTAINISGATGVSASIDGATLTIAHDVFAYETAYEVTIPAGAVNDMAHNALAEAKVWSFTTEIAPDITPPTVVGTTPEADVTNVAIDAVVSATFDEAIQEGDNFTAINISGATGVSASIDGATLTIAHDVFAYETAYEVTIPAGAVNDMAHNALAEAKVWSFTTRGAGPISFTTTLSAGWNLLSTPIKLDADSDSLGQIFDTDSNIEVCYGWDAEGQQWTEALTAGYELSPLEAIYIKVSSGASATAEFIPSQELSSLPSRELQPGLNLISPAPALEAGVFPGMPLDLALVSIAEAEGGLRGYTMVVSPAYNQPGWSYALGGEIQDLLPYKGYWVVMENAPDTLYGFSTTPIE